jgi:spore germination protein YaaH
MRRLVAGAIVLAACLAAAGSVGAARERTTAATCASRPVALRFLRSPGTFSGVLTWRAPAKVPRRAAGYRVYRDNKVAGQTKMSVRRFRLAFVPGRPVRFAVRVALRSGAVLPCTARLRQVVRWRPPATPRNLAVHPEDDSVTLSWEASRNGDGKLNGYRLFLNGRTFKQLKTTSVTVAVPPLKQVTFAVAAVDTRGTLSPLSNTVTITAGHAAPDTPAGVAAQAMSDTAVGVSWQPSVGHGGARVAYRILRDGKTVGQTPSTSFTVGHLAASTNYTFSVVAVDSLNYASAPSPPVAVTTAAPQQSHGSAHVFLLASTGASFVDFQEHYQQIGTVYPTYEVCNDDGTFTGQDDPLVTGWARLRGVRVEPRWNCQSLSVLHSILSDPAKRAALEQQMVSAAAASNWDGINLDFEGGAPADRNAYSTFVAELASALHAQGKTLSVDASAKTKDVMNHPRSTFFDYDALSQSADTIFVMCWGIHWSTSAPGAIDDWSWVTAVVAYLDQRPRKDKYVVGFGLYGFDWPNGGGGAYPGTALEYKDVQALASRTGAQVQWDATAVAPYFTYTDGNGVRHDVWFTDGQSIGRRVQLAHDHGLGIGFWRLGEEDEGIWQSPLLQPGAW